MATTPTIAAQHVAPINLICGATTSVGKEGYAYKWGSSDVVINSAQGEYCLPLVGGAAAGEAVVLAGPGSVVPVIVDEAITVGTELTSNGSGKWEAAASSDVVTCRALQTSTANGDYILAVVIGSYVKA